MVLNTDSARRAQDDLSCTTMRTSCGMMNRSIVDARVNSPGPRVLLSAMRISYEAADKPNDLPRTTPRSTNGEIIGAGVAHRRRISCAGKIIVLLPSNLTASASALGCAVHAA